MLKPALIKYPKIFSQGLQAIVTLKSSPELGMNFSLLSLEPGASYDYKSGYESAWLLLGGQVMFNKRLSAERSCLFTKNPWVAHSPKESLITIEAQAKSELVLIELNNPASFCPQIFGPHNLMQSEQRGAGLWDNSARRIVRTVFDRRNRPEANLVLGEVVNAPGRWSSYPPHHHPQPELYHYRFTHQAGYGHGEMGEDVYKICHGDSLVIKAGHTHAQVAAPAYGMYYLWAIRQSPEQPYTTPVFAPEHAWLLD